MSPVIGIILLTAVTVALVSLAAFFVFDVGQSSSSGVGTATVSAGYESESRIDVQLLKSGSADRVIVRSALGTEYVLDEAGETVKLLNQDGNQTPVVLGEKNGDRTVLREVPPRSFSPDIVVAKTDSEGQYSSIGSALRNSVDGDIIVLQKGVYYENIDISTSNVTLVGESGTVIADSNDESSVIDVKADGVRISNINVNANSSQGGVAAEYGINVQKSVKLSSTSISNASTDSTKGTIERVSNSAFVSSSQLLSDNRLNIPETVTERFNRTYDDGYSDRGFSVATDSDENIYVTGSSQINGTNWDYYTIKYDKSGDVVWSRIYDGGNSDRGIGVAVDGGGNVYVTGLSRSSNRADYYTIKYNSSGTELWSRRYDGNGSNDYAYDVTVDKDGNVYVTGQSILNGDMDYYTIKYASDGATVWSARYDGGNGEDESYGVGVDGDKNVYVTGHSFDGSDRDIVTIKYNSTGDVQWKSNYDNGYYDSGRALAVGTNGNIHINGMSNNSQDLDYYTVKYSDDGSKVWDARYDGGGRDVGDGISLDAENSVYVTGNVRKNGSDGDRYTIKYNSTGSQQWTKRYDSGFEDRGHGIAVTFDGVVAVFGESSNGNDRDYYTTKYK